MSIEEDLDEVYTVLGSPIRRRIILLLAEKGPLTFSELKREIKVGVGTLYYNLDGLKGFVERGKGKKYYLTKRGRALYEFIREGNERIRGLMREKPRLRMLLENPIVGALTSTRLIVPLYGNSKLSLLVLAASLLLGLITVSVSRLELVLLEVRLTPLFSFKNILGLYVSPEAYLILELFLSVALSVAILHLAAHVLTGHSQVRPGFVSAISLSFIPIYFYMFLQYLATGYEYPAIPVRTALTLAVTLRLLQLVALGMISASVSVFYRTSRERGFLVAALLLYTSFLLNSVFP